MVLKEGDDMYLLRLVVTTGAKSDRVIQSLDVQTSNVVLARINKIVRGGVFEHHLVNWFEGSQRSGHFDQLSEKEQNDYMDTLF